MADETNTTPKKMGKVARGKLERMGVALERIDALLLRLGQQGLQRMSRSSLTELQAMKMTAHNAALITIERQLDALTTYVERYMDRDPLFSMSQYMGSLNRIWLLTQAARRRYDAGETPDQMVDLVGELRRQYRTLDAPIIVQPLGANGWVTDTGFVGVTLYLAVRGSGGVIYQASNAKPTMYFGEDPRRLLGQQISDYLHYTIRDFAHGAFCFSNAKLSSDGRLSLHKELRVSEAPYMGNKAYQDFAVDRWIELVDRIRANQLDPFSGSGSIMAFIEPSGFGDFDVDIKSSRASARVFDDKGASLLMEVPLRSENNFLIDNLEGMFSDTSSFPLPNALFGRVFIHGGVVRMFPITAIYNDAVSIYRGPSANEVHLSLEGIQYKRRKRR